MSVRGSIVLAALLAATACSGDGGDGVQGPGDGAEGDVLVENNRFDPATLQVETGATVVWAWASNGVLHNVTFEDDVTSGNQGSGTYERTFAEAGAYDYLCTIHGVGMSGTITVAAPATDNGNNGY
jgi:plastocyanin